MEVEEKEPLPVRLKYYTTLTLGLVACLSCFIFMFMVPFVLDPTISTLVANFDPDPVTCKTVYIDRRNGAKSCKWASCKIGCTTDQYSCERIYVNYVRTRYSEYIEEDFETDEMAWTIEEVPVYVNIKACGYEPKVNCSEFSILYARVGATFACYYSRVDPRLVITDYSWDDAVNSLVMAILIPNALTAISLAVLSYWWYPGCQKRRCHYQLPPDQEAASSQHGEEDEEVMDDDEDGEDRDLKKEKNKITEEEEDELSARSKSDDDQEEGDKDKDATIINIPEVKA